ncbi:MAG: cupin domain-containing protein [Sulfolobales archaeon]|nr:cupin domain-containing protein [Sulfolobales archaeon]MCX8186973.1 cupin domain-containing protein [Sulfolobales archaeon]MDW7968803.1 cupin domain-containing protein [Sulfolobales archaeon]
MKSVRVVNVNDVEAVVPLMCDVGGFRVKRLITKRREGSDKLTLGLCFIEPNARGYRWTFKDRDEVYYVLRGNVRLKWGESSAVLKEGDAVYLPAGYEYELDNLTNEAATIVYVITPPVE